MKRLVFPVILTAPNHASGAVTLLQFHSKASRPQNYRSRTPTTPPASIPPVPYAGIVSMVDLYVSLVCDNHAGVLVYQGANLEHLSNGTLLER